MNSTDSLISRSKDTAVLQTTGTKPVQIWAFFGAALFLFVTYLFFQWVTGPYFTPVPTGVTEPPMYMKIFLSANAAVLTAGLPFAIWYFWIKPWREERRITLDGMLIPALNLMIFIDPMLN
ncbi:MAG: hypothetical protein MI976_20675, partial [Pseudomonadales bacterium]|nr:hypothetical protein [Pseudomonadales bacterium]